MFVYILPVNVWEKIYTKKICSPKRAVLQLSCNGWLLNLTFSSCWRLLFTVGESIEDIVPFPSESSSLLSDSLDTSSSEARPSLTDSIEELTCKYGSCSREQKRQCLGRLRAYRSSVVNVAVGDEGVRVSQPRRCPKDEYQTNRFLVLLVLLLLSMFIVSQFLFKTVGLVFAVHVHRESIFV